MGLFAPKCPLSLDEWEWQLACFKWLLEEFGGLEQHRRSDLVLPNADFFPPTGAQGEDFVAEILDQIKSHCGMSEWPTRLVIGEAGKAMDIGTVQHLVHDRHANLGEFRVVEDGSGGYVAEITYNPDLAARPSKLIATLSHELGHYLLSGAKKCPPGGRDIEEHATDLATVYMGFGIFLANDARSFSGHSQGWQTEWQGYLSETALITALTISETLAGRDPMEAAPHLKSYLAKDLSKAVKFCRDRNLIEEIMAVDLTEYGVK